jgi:hypothetical protein
MSKSEDLIAAGIVTINPDDATEVLFNIGIHVKKAAIDADGLEAFAGMYGWTPTIPDPTDPTLPQIPNPVVVTDKCRSIIVNFVRDVFAAAISKQIDEQAQAQKEQMLGALM